MEFRINIRDSSLSRNSEDQNSLRDLVIMNFQMMSSEPTDTCICPFKCIHLESKRFRYMPLNCQMRVSESSDTCILTFRCLHLTLKMYASETSDANI